MKFSGQEIFPQSAAAIWTRLIDLESMARILPDMDRVEEVGSDLLRCRVNPAFSFLAGSLQLQFSLQEQDQEKYLKISVQAKKIGAGLKLEITLALVPDADGTCLSWEATILERNGLLKPISESLIRAAAEKVIARTWSGFHQAMSEESHCT